MIFTWPALGSYPIPDKRAVGISLEQLFTHFSADFPAQRGNFLRTISSIVIEITALRAGGHGAVAPP
jgi:hypothetical protein